MSKIDWRPIETADKSHKRGASILLWLKPDDGPGYPVIGNYYENLLYGPVWEYDGERSAALDVATHWADLPEGPDA